MLQSAQESVLDFLPADTLVVVDDLAAGRERLHRYQGVFENAPLGMALTTPQGRYIDANTALARLYGYDSPVQLTRTVKDIAGQLYADPAKRDEITRRLAEDGRVTSACRPSALLG